MTLEQIITEIEQAEQPEHVYDVDEMELTFYTIDEDGNEVPMEN